MSIDTGSMCTKLDPVVNNTDDGWRDAMQWAGAFVASFKSPETRRAYRRVATLSSWFAWLEDEAVNVGNAAARVRRPRRHAAPQPWCHRNELTDLLAAGNRMMPHNAAAIVRRLASATTSPNGPSTATQRSSWWRPPRGDGGGLNRLRVAPPDRAELRLPDGSRGCREPGAGGISHGRRAA